MKFTKVITTVATSPKYGDVSLSLNFEFNNETNTSTLTLPDGYTFGSQISGYLSDGQPLAISKVDDRYAKFYSLKALTKLGTNHLFVFKVEEKEQNKKTRFILNLSFFSATIKQDICEWRKTLNDSPEGQNV